MADDTFNVTSNTLTDGILTGDNTADYTLSDNWYTDLADAGIFGGNEYGATDSQGNYVGVDPNMLAGGSLAGVSQTDFERILGNLNSLFSGKSSLGRPGQLLGFAGIASLLNRLTRGSNAPTPTGYQGGIPQYTAARQQYAFSPSAQVGTATDDQIQRFINQRGVTDPMIAQNMRNYGVTPERMAGIAKSIAEGAMAFLKREYRILSLFMG